ncbi:MAG: DNA-directed RNA polymerase subunit beta' [Alphaproteobacteria bacterium]|nr:DNA-directed RNA polymerase subunit beta' [Alphaproteobacteria bacterium]
MKQNIKTNSSFDSISIHLATPSDILSWSHGEIQKAETINYRTQRSEVGGLFCERIFGPEVDFSCSCGKYKGSQYHGIICDKCGVEITKSSVRRERMGHIVLASPICHIWFLRKSPSRLSQFLGKTATELQKVIYYSAYIITSIDEQRIQKYKQELKKSLEQGLATVQNTESKKKIETLYQDRINELDSIVLDNIIDETTYYIISKKYADAFEAEKGAEAIYNILKKVDLKKKEEEIRKKLLKANKTNNEKLRKQLNLVKSFIESKSRPEHMFLTHLPVIPVGVRPLVPLDGGRYASSDLNDLYRMIIIRNNRLKNFIENKAPKIFIDTQKRLLQEAVDALFDSSIEYNSTNTSSKSQNRKLKSLADSLIGKKGFFRQNLLGKRVDYSARSVIVVGPHLMYDECGLPKDIALELFRPFLIADIIESGLAHNIRSASRIIDDRYPVVYDILDRIVKDKYVLLNRQPTLHRQGIQAFRPVLIEGKAIELHPLVCEAYNADFDGDQMAVHLPLSDEAQTEARLYLVSTKNLVNAGSGKMNMGPAKMDIVLGCYYATIDFNNAINPKAIQSKTIVGYYSSMREAIRAYGDKVISLHSPIAILVDAKEKRFVGITTPYFVTSVGRILFNQTLPDDFLFVNETLTKSQLTDLSTKILDTYGMENSVKYFDAMKSFGFNMATISATTFSIFELKEPADKKIEIQQATQTAEVIYDEYEQGYISEDERTRKVLDTWKKAKENLVKKIQETMDLHSSVSLLITSGARGDMGGYAKMTGMYGAVNTNNSANEYPIAASFLKGLTPLEYFLISYENRKGGVGTAIKTANAGYLTRRLFDVAQEINVVEEDCGTTRGFVLYRKTLSGVGAAFSKRIYGRFTAEDVEGKNGVILKKNTLITKEFAELIEKNESVDSVRVRSPITCRNAHGVCIKCYGVDSSTGELIGLGEPVGTIAAQAIGEPGTQLTVSSVKGTTKTSGTISQDINAGGLPRLEELLEARTPKNQTVIARCDGIIKKIETLSNGFAKLEITPTEGKPTKDMCEYEIHKNRYILVKEGQEVQKGMALTDGSFELNEYSKYVKKEVVQEYIFAESRKVYEIQGQEILPVHFEIMIRQMFSRYVIKDIGDSTFLEGDVLDLRTLTHINEELEKKNKKIIQAESIVTGIINVSTNRSNFLVAASFQTTVNVLIRTSLEGRVSVLDGVKENVIIGRLPPVGSGFVGSKKYDTIQKVIELNKERIFLEGKKKEIEQ